MSRRKIGGESPLIVPENAAEMNVEVDVDFPKGLVILKARGAFQVEPYVVPIAVADFLELAANLTLGLLAYQRRVAQQQVATPLHKVPT